MGGVEGKEGVGGGVGGEFWEENGGADMRMQWGKRGMKSADKVKEEGIFDFQSNFDVCAGFLCCCEDEERFCSTSGVPSVNDLSTNSVFVDVLCIREGRVNVLDFKQGCMMRFEESDCRDSRWMPPSEGRGISAPSQCNLGNTNTWWTSSNPSSTLRHCLRLGGPDGPKKVDWPFRRGADLPRVILWIFKTYIFEVPPEVSFIRRQAVADLSADFLARIHHQHILHLRIRARCYKISVRPDAHILVQQPD
eukprot:760149-Hanusia_phi.AAC.6